MKPIADVRVEFIENPALAVITDQKGEFIIPPSYKPELFIPLGDQPHAMDMFSSILPRLRVTKEGYETRELDGFDPQFLDPECYTSSPWPNLKNDAPVLLRPIFLVRRAEPEKPNKAPEPTTTAVTSPAAQEPRQP